ncbi:MAG: 2-succinyl-5-enolpyruvyl-6-hydroxy-3-cyclohexene-1-carboxylic-acid synthase [Chloroflexi bacterium]|nr:2-succinyl-5-enolpyruvyl-6-hydroxy-3-cyclohexene-1-carboxylic-acid synthase [Chloroflexota bacterium]
MLRPYSVPQSAYFFLNAFVDELSRAGVKQLVFCPGSRSTPLALRFAAHADFKLWQHLDERSAAFFALGIGKASGVPAALLCTSGTAAANFFPAIIEAHYARVPLIVLTADRPPELRDSGAPQTIDQIKLFGDHAKWFVEVALPEATADLLRYARTIACRAVEAATNAPAGAVHLNFPFREPLIPEPAQMEYDARERDAFEGRENGQPFARITPSVRVPDATQIAALAQQWQNVERGLVIAGPQSHPDEPAAIAAVSDALGYPLLADPLSLARCGSHSRANVMDSYDAFLRDAKIVERLEPEIVLRFGALPTSKPVLQFLQRYPQAQQILIDAGGWNDPTRLAAHIIHADARAFADALLRSLAPRNETSAWLATWRDANARTQRAITEQLAAFDEMFEGRVLRELADLLPAHATLFASSSMPVRDLDTFFPSNAHEICFLANRGANGIDGVVSSALGAGAVSAGPLVLVIGDLAFYHDLNGLFAAKRHRLHATIVLIHNDGGGIFSFLPQAAHAAKMYDAVWHEPQTWAEFRAAVQTSIASDGLHIVQVRTDRARNVTMHWQVRSAIRRIEFAATTTPSVPAHTKCKVVRVLLML